MWYARHARRQADAAERAAEASERSLRFLTREQREGDVERLQELRRKIRFVRDKMMQRANTERLAEKFSERDSHNISKDRLEAIQRLASRLAYLPSAQAALRGVEAAEEVRKRWGEAALNWQPHGEDSPAFRAVRAAAREAHESFAEAHGHMNDDLESLTQPPA